MGKANFYDDGRTVASMDFDQVPYKFKRLKDTKEKEITTGDVLTQNKKDNQLNLTRKEQFALVIGLYQVLIPIVLLFVSLYFIAFLLLDAFWLN